MSEFENDLPVFPGLKYKTKGNMDRHEPSILTALRQASTGKKIYRRSIMNMSDDTDLHTPQLYDLNPMPAPNMRRKFTSQPYSNHPETDDDTLHALSPLTRFSFQNSEMNTHYGIYDGCEFDFLFSHKTNTPPVTPVAVMSSPVTTNTRPQRPRVKRNSLAARKAPTSTITSGSLLQNDVIDLSSGVSDDVGAGASYDMNVVIDLTQIPTPKAWKRSASNLDDDAFASTGKKSSMECPICMEDLHGRPTCATVCGHVFCKECIETSILSKKCCPQCRRHLTKNKIHPLFLPA